MTPIVLSRAAPFFFVLISLTIFHSILMLVSPPFRSILCPCRRYFCFHISQSFYADQFVSVLETRRSNLVLDVVDTFYAEYM